MKTKRLLILTLIVAAAMNTKAQTISCSSFCITDIQMDTLPNTMNVTVYFFEADTNITHINYPYISVITDSNGDTVATGTMNFFVQSPNTSQTYSMTTSMTSVPPNFYCTAFFNYDTSVCELYYPCTIDTSISCSDFCATDIQIASSGFMNVSMFMYSTDTVFVSYPYISAITDTNGDTVAIGALSFYGQFGNTTQIHQLSTSLTSIPANFTGTLHFHYNSQNCMLSYPCTPLSIKEEDIFVEKIHVYPNPIDLSGSLYIAASESLKNSNIQVVNSMGQIILNQKLDKADDHFIINLSDHNFVPGIYYLISDTARSKNTAKFIVR